MLYWIVRKNYSERNTLYLISKVEKRSTESKCQGRSSIQRGWHLQRPGESRAWFSEVSVCLEHSKKE